MEDTIKWDEVINYLKNSSKRKHKQIKIYNNITGRYLEKNFLNRYYAKMYIRKLNLNRKVFEIQFV